MSRYSRRTVHYLLPSLHSESATRLPAPPGAVTYGSTVESFGILPPCYCMPGPDSSAQVRSNYFAMDPQDRQFSKSACAVIAELTACHPADTGLLVIIQSLWQAYYL